MLESAGVPPAAIAMLGQAGDRAKKLWATARDLSRGDIVSSLRSLVHEAMAHEGIVKLRSGSKTGSSGAMTLAIRSQAENLLATVRASIDRIIAQLQAAIADLALSAAPVDAIRGLALKLAEKVDVQTIHTTALSILDRLPVEQAKALGASALAHARPLADALIARWASAVPVEKLRSGARALLERLEGTALMEVIGNADPNALPSDWNPSAGNGLAAAAKARAIEAATSAAARSPTNGTRSVSSSKNVTPRE